MCLAPASSCWLSCAFPAGLKGPFRACCIPGTFLQSGFKAPLDPPLAKPQGPHCLLAFQRCFFSPQRIFLPLLFALSCFSNPSLTSHISQPYMEYFPCSHRCTRTVPGPQQPPEPPQCAGVTGSSLGGCQSSKNACGAAFAPPASKVFSHLMFSGTQPPSLRAWPIFPVSRSQRCLGFD